MRSASCDQVNEKAEILSKSHRMILTCRGNAYGVVGGGPGSGGEHGKGPNK
jgi:hypothetical protein